jgi:predicted O-methyltransferase YrrM
MGLLGSAKASLNRILRPFNVRFDSRTAERTEEMRLASLVRSGHFERPVFPILEQFLKCDPRPVLATVRDCEALLGRFAERNVSRGYCFENGYYESPDAEVLYAMVRMYRPVRIIEVGSGNSTMLFREAIKDAGLTTRLISIDPHPRREIESYADEVLRQRLENIDFGAHFGDMGEGDILFIDSSHVTEPGNDVVLLFLKILPALTSGAIVHIHDVFLPFEYPEEWLVEHRWKMNEQYLLQALLQGSDQFDVLWAGRYLQYTLADFASNFRYWQGASAKSIWLRRTDARS